MIWQDVVFAAGSVFFAISLLPTVFDRTAAVPRITSIPTAGTLVGFAVAQWSLGCRWAPCFELLTAAVWAWIAWRRAGAVLYGGRSG